MVSIDLFGYVSLLFIFSFTTLLIGLLVRLLTRGYAQMTLVAGFVGYFLTISIKILVEVTKINTGLLEFVTLITNIFAREEIFFALASFGIAFDLAYIVISLLNEKEGAISAVAYPIAIVAFITQIVVASFQLFILVASKGCAIVDGLCFLLTRFQFLEFIPSYGAAATGAALMLLTVFYSLQRKEEFSESLITTVTLLISLTAVALVIGWSALTMPGIVGTVYN